MATQMSVEPGWAVLATWGIVNLVNLLQSAGFFSRLRNGDMTINHWLGYGMMALAVLALAALVAFLRAGASPLQWIGLVVYLIFIAFMIVVDYAHPVEFRSPQRVEILVPYLVLFFGAIVLMGLPMFRIDRRLWLVTVATSVLLVVSMGVAMRKGVG